MHYKALALSALAVTVSAQTTTSAALSSAASSAIESDGTPQSGDVVSILSVLQTALPSSLYAEAQTNPAAASSEVESAFAAGATPAWFTGLPTDIQTLLLQTATAVAGGNASALQTGTIINGTIVSGNATATGNSTDSTGGVGGHRTSPATTNAQSTSSGSAGSQSSVAAAGGSSSGANAGSSASRSSSSSGGASMPTQMVGAGIVGVVGIVGLLAL